MAAEIDPVSASPPLRQLLRPGIFVYAFRAVLMRAPTAIFFASAIASLACANRGMHAPRDGGPGVGGTVATAGRGGQGGQSGSSGRGGTGPQDGTGGATGTGGQTAGTSGANCGIVADAGASGGSGGACGAMFNFESGAQGAMINSGSLAFTNLAPSGTFTFCGTGALAITSLFSGTSGPTTKGEVLINLPGAGTTGIDLTGKTITVRVAANPGCSSDLNLSLVVNTTAGPLYFTQTFPIRPLTNMWKTGTATVTPDAGSTSALALSLQVTSQSNYQGTIYLDEIDIR
jgi:hypothetical protein